MNNPIAAKLADSARRHGSEPLLTWYAADGARTELSVRSFANWVDKTANLLLSWDLDHDIVLGRVSRDHPGHWMSLIWPVATWQAGCTYTTVDGPSAVVVGGPAVTAAPSPTITVACSLHPLGFGLRDLPDQVFDFSTEALAQPDARQLIGVDEDEPAWIDADGARNHGELLATPQAHRVLVRPCGGWQTLAEAVIGPLVGGGSAVIVEDGFEPDRLARLIADERITAPVA